LDGLHLIRHRRRRLCAGAVKVRQKDKTTNEHIVGTIAAAAASDAPALESKTYDSVTLTPMSDYEYPGTRRHMAGRQYLFRPEQRHHVQLRRPE
jgi:hypothetical protein